MFEAIHKNSGKRITAFRLRYDLEWQGKERDDFYAPIEYIENAEELISKGKKEIKVSFVKEHLRYEGTEKEEDVSAHFRIEDSEAIENKWVTESQEHKLAKQHIVNNLNVLTIYDGQKEVPIHTLEIEDVHIERGIGFKRADVLIDFKKFHEIYGKGICVEIQLSSQKESITNRRTFDRCSYGYSVCWIWSDELEKFNNRLRVTPFNQGIKKYIEELDQIHDDRFSDIAIKIKRLYAENLQNLQSEVEKNKLNLQSIQNIKLGTIQEFRSWTDLATIKVKEDAEKTFTALFKEEISKISLNPYIDKYMQSREQYISLLIHKYLQDNIRLENKSTDFLNNLINNLKIEYKEKLSSLVSDFISKQEDKLNTKMESILANQVNSMLPNILEGYLSNNLNKILNETREKVLQKAYLDLANESTISYLKNKTEIFLEDPETKEMKNIHEFSIKKNKDGTFSIKRLINESKD